MSTALRRRTFTVNEYHQMAKTGIFREDERIELLKGDILAMPPIGSYHASRVAKLDRIFEKRLGESVIVWVQNPVHIDDSSEPEPDIALLKPQADFYAASLPRPDDILLLVEIADASLENDRGLKLPLYAKAGIREVWIVNLRDACVEVYTEPEEQGYMTLRRFHPGKTLIPTAFPELQIAVDDILSRSAS